METVLHTEKKGCEHKSRNPIHGVLSIDMVLMLSTLAIIVFLWLNSSN